MATRIDEEFRYFLRTFAFFVGNGALLKEDEDGFVRDYDVYLSRRDGIFGTLFAVFVNNFRRCPDDSASDRASTWMASVMGLEQPESDFADWETAIAEPDQNAYGVIKEFSVLLGNEQLGGDVLKNTDYFPHLFMYGSTLEGVYAVLTNVIRMDDVGVLINRDEAFRRAAQYLRHDIDPGYVVEPPFEDWELELV